MKKLTSLATVLALGLSSVAQAGGPGPVVVEDAPVIVEDTGSSGSFGSLGGAGVIGALVLLAVIAAIASGDDDEDETAERG